MRSKKLTSKINLYFTILELFKQNKTTSQISKELNISKQKLYYYTRRLRDLGFLQKKGYLVWEVLRSKKIDLEHTIIWKSKSIRGHAFIWKVKLSRIYDWKLVLDKKNIPYKLVRGCIPRIFINNKKVWLTKYSIIIYETKSFYGKDAIQSRKYAVFSLLDTLNDFSNKVGINIGRVYFKPTREHYGMIKNELARQLNDKGEKLIIRDDLDGEWFWIDDSNGMFGEMETGGKGFTKDRAGLNLEVQNWWNDMKRTDFKVTPTFLMENINKVVQVQKVEQKNKVEYSRDLVQHKEAIKTMGRNTEANTKSIELLADVVLQLKEEVKKLNDR
ncbi:MAG TPA: hypothetical protein ENG87_01720 [Candidatus Pacearchaeota archaeon]|nr:hypothetical protein [Candidatus Pacearchaeota archaeon]